MTHFIIPLIPMAAPRPRFSKFGTYNPKKYTDYKKAVALLAKNLFEPRENVPVKLLAIFYMPIPKSYSRKKREELAGGYHVKKPDADNLLKTVKDALNGIAYKDDSQVCLSIVHKLHDIVPRSEIYITYL